MHVIVGDFTPELLDFGCDELYYLATALELWLPWELIPYFGKPFPYDAFKEGEAENLVSLVPSFILPTPEDRAWALEITEEMIQGIVAVRIASLEMPDEERYVRRPTKECLSDPETSSSASGPGSEPLESRTEDDGGCETTRDAVVRAI